MNSKAVVILKLFLWFICLFHIIVGVGLNVWPDMAGHMAKCYGVKVPLTPQLAYMLKPLGAFMFALGLFAMIAAKDPIKHISTVYIFATLFTIRGLHRLIFQSDIERLFMIPSSKLLMGMAVFIAMAVLLLVLGMSVSKQANE